VGHACRYRLGTTFRIIHLLVPRAPRGRNPSSANIGSVPPHKNELEYGFPRVSIGYPSTVPPPLVAMMRSAPSRGCLRYSLPPVVPIDEEAGNPPVGWSFIQLAVPAHSARELDWGPELTPTNNIRTVIDEGRVRLFRSNKLLFQRPVLSSPLFLLATREGKATHQQPPQIPLCFSTTRLKSGHVVGPSSRTENRAVDSSPCFRSDRASRFEPKREVVDFFMIRISRLFAAIRISY